MSWQKHFRKKEISDADISRLEAFVALVSEIQNRRYLQRTSHRFSITFDAQSGVKQSTDHGDSEDFRSAILSIRKIVAKREPTLSNKIYNLLFRLECSDAMRKLLGDARADIKNTRNHPAEHFVDQEHSGNFPVFKPGRSRKEVLRQVIAQLFHTDGTHQEPLPDMTGSSFPDGDLRSSLLRHEVITLINHEVAFANLLRDYIVSQGKPADNLPQEG
jgi:hypothetical protein